ncbi:hypothetical protein [Pimelobacter sp. 30-1]|uniref:hypothetical protein n=1 Tax=Pimelobacter sp. 30-1 TaxID=2004991 RepID=UPI001C058F0D|nr:hypothetical protein [Pimelobacter sp. 30-1]MBU2698919.1 hypothetical protein [Pimelobacter sp. 30-1]
MTSQLWNKEDDGAADAFLHAVAHAHLRIAQTEEEREKRLPHVVVCTDAGTGHYSLDGPYADAASAAQAAQEERQRTTDDLGLTFTTMPIYPPLERDQPTYGSA